MPENENEAGTPTIAEVQQSLLAAIKESADECAASSSDAEQYASAALKLVEAHRILGGY